MAFNNCGISLHTGVEKKWSSSICELVKMFREKCLSCQVLGSMLVFLHVFSKAGLQHLTLKDEVFWFIY